MSVAVPNWARNNRVYGTFRRQISNDPTALFCKVIALQGMFWAASLVLSTALYVLDADLGWPALFRFDKLGVIGGYRALLPAIAFTMNAGIGGMLLKVVVERGRMCLDFAVTLFVLHFCFSSIVSGYIPLRPDVYGLYLGGVAVMTAVGVTLCQRHELLPIQSAGSLKHPNAVGARWRERLFGVS